MHFINLKMNEIWTELSSYVPNAFWNRKKYKVFLSYVEGFDENQIKYLLK